MSEPGGSFFSLVRQDKGRSAIMAIVVGVVCVTLFPRVSAEAQSSREFPPFMPEGFDYASFARFKNAAPPKSLIYQSNGFMAMQEFGFGGQTILIPVSGDPTLTNGSDRLAAVRVKAPTFIDASGKTYTFADSEGRREVTQKSLQSSESCVWRGKASLSFGNAEDLNCIPGV